MNRAEDTPCPEQQPNHWSTWTCTLRMGHAGPHKNRAGLSWGHRHFRYPRGMARSGDPTKNGVFYAMRLPTGKEIRVATR